MRGQDFDAFARAGLPGLGRYAVTLTGDAESARDLVRDTLVRVARDWRTAEVDRDPMAYARMTMRSLAARRHGRRRASVESSLADGSGEVLLGDMRADDVMAAIGKKLARGRLVRWATTGAAALVLVVAAVLVIGGARHDEASGAAPLLLKGLPSGWTLMADVEASAEQPPAVTALPFGGRRSAYQRIDMQGAWRIIAISDFDRTRPVGLPGLHADVPREWAIGGHVLMRESGNTLFLSTTRSDGTSWFVAVTGGEDIDRLAVMQIVAERNVRGS